MAYKKYYETLDLKRDTCRITARVFAQSTQYGFRHVCDFITFEIYKDKAIIDLPNINVRCCYYNRTWENWRFQSVILKTARKYLNDEQFKIIKEALC